MRNGKFVLTVNSIKTSRTRAKTWLILLGKQFRSVTQPRDKRDTESRRSADNLASLQTSSHSSDYIKRLHSRVRSQSALIDIMRSMGPIVVGLIAKFLFSLFVFT